MAMAGVTRRTVLKGLALASLGGVLAACGGSAAAPASSPVPSGAPSAWEQVLKDARAEGSVNVYGGEGEEKRRAMIDPKQFTSYLDVLDPKWKGKMVATDTRKAGAGAVAMRFLYRNQALGPTYLEHLFGDMELTLSSDNRQMIDWIVQGQYPIGLF